jgi:proteic killer suppression protein
MIVSFWDRATEDVYHNRPTRRARRFSPDLVDLALVKMDLLNGAAAMRDLRSPPGNHLEALRGDLKGYHSIRVNEQWRLVFRWEDGNARKVWLTDYHR